MPHRSGILPSPLPGRRVHDPGDTHDTNWESVWIDLGGEG
jgi:hypothetical protein